MKTQNNFKPACAEVLVSTIMHSRHGGQLGWMTYQRIPNCPLLALSSHATMKNWKTNY